MQEPSLEAFHSDCAGLPPVAWHPFRQLRLSARRTTASQRAGMTDQQCSPLRSSPFAASAYSFILHCFVLHVVICLCEEVTPKGYQMQIATEVAK